MEPIKYTKRVGHLFERMVDIENIKAAIKGAAKRKSGRPSVVRVLNNIDHYAEEIQKMLINETFVPHPYTIREINDGIKLKKRMIAVPRFYPDQCVHHAFVQIFRELVIHGAYEHSCGCIPGKGTDGAKQTIERWIRNDPAGTSKVLKLDTAHCYPTVSHEALRNKLRKRIKDRRFLRLANVIICSYQQAMADHTPMLPETEAVGIPVGLYPSPWFLNFLYQDIDHAIAERSGCKHYVRYADDMVLFDSSKRRLHKALRFIDGMLHQVKMTIKSNWQVFRLRVRPLDFLGFKFHADGHTTIRRSIMLRISRKAKSISNAAHITGIMACGMVSYMGYILHSDSWNFYNAYVKPFVNMKYLKGVVSHENRKQNCTVCPV